MDSERLLATLESAGVVESPRDGSMIRLAEPFTAAVIDRRESLADLEDAAIASTVETEVVVEHEPLLDAVSCSGSTFVSRCLVLADRVPDLGAEAVVRTALVLDRFDDQRIPDQGAPDGFLPIRGDRIEVATALSRSAIVYVWREDCQPCDVMREEFESRFPERTDDIALYAVYGPDWAQRLHERYDVGGGPTTLFFVDGRVDARLVGAHYGSKIAHEIEQLREASSG